MHLSLEFYQGSDTLSIARALIGKVLRTEIDGKRCAGIINETEAYLGSQDRASHSYGGRHTQRTAVMYEPGGISYIYLCYGIHEMFNVVTHIQSEPHAVLIRSLIPYEGEITMMERCNKKSLKGLSDGPGKVCKAMGIDRSLNGISLDSDMLSISDQGIVVPDSEIQVGPRIGVDFAKEDALLPYRFLWEPPVPTL